MVGAAPEFDPAQAPGDPVALFVQWLLHAVDSGIVEPHAMTLSTVGAAAGTGGSRPSARVLILKDIDAAGWHFGVSSASRKGADLARNPAVSLTFYWPALGRQVRVDGIALPDPPPVTADDFLARSEGARAMVLTGRQSEPYDDPAEISEALAKAHLELERSPTLVPAEWVSYAVQADAVEFWQADSTRRHRRLRYERDGTSWSTTLLWP
ncbi:pyridoxal 5'-phosphate synthase [Mycolicibacter heraklionensis]|uniref:Pyridoxal 5'-phosphate synthase n=1 Tax=Mycolicibacter heraklionensis TaxID=512402 RepID=A0A9X7WLF3_9MYCO|nr:pyridoxal 5'-phosphate synthase [Mycolicibacter heraklionensis]QZA09430.1 pyridoxal 5'-phosphate synthase [Mycolicibacter heraklionensis]